MAADDRVVLDVDGAAALLGRSRSWVYQRVAERAIPHCRLPGCGVLFKKSGKQDPYQLTHEILAALGANGQDGAPLPADVDRLTTVCQSHRRAAVLGALDYALERRAQGQVEHSVLSYLISVVGKVPPRTERQTPEEQRERAVRQAVKRELSDLALPANRFRDRIEVLVKQHDTKKRAEAKDALFAGERAKLVDSTNHEAWYEHHLQHLEANTCAD